MSPFSGPSEGLTIPDEGLVEHLLSLSADDAERVAIIDAGVKLTYGELATAVDATAARLRNELAPGQVVALVGQNSADWVVAMLGCLRAGIVVTPVNALATAEEIAKQLVDASAVMVLADAPRLDVATRAAGRARVVPIQVRALAEAVCFETAAAPFELGYSAATSLAVLPYSSGTTGRPKGVMLTHRNLVANVCQIDEVFGVDEGSSVLALLPFSHMYGLTVVLHLTLKKRGRVVVLPRFDVLELLSVVERERLTHLFVAPPVAVELAKADAVLGRDFSSVRLLVSAAAPLDEMLALAVSERLGCEVRQAYGMSEMSPVSHVAALDAPQIARSSVGQVLPGMKCRVIDPLTGRDVDIPLVGPSAPGELCCSGPNVMVGYLNDQEATAEIIDADGFLHTGDMATIDAHGVVTIVDRLKELIKYKGYQVAPAELEGLLLEHEAIVDAAVIGVPIGEAGDEAPRAFIVRRRGADISAANVMEYVAARVAGYKKVRSVEFVDVIPKSPAGKILRRELRDR